MKAKALIGPEYVAFVAELKSRIAYVQEIDGGLTKQLGEKAEVAA